MASRRSGGFLRDGDIVLARHRGRARRFHRRQRRHRPGLAPFLPSSSNLLRVTEEALRIGIAQAIAGKSHRRHSPTRFQQHVEANQFSVVRDMVRPRGSVSRCTRNRRSRTSAAGTPATRSRRDDPSAIEPMVNLGAYKTKMLPDGWTVVTADGSPPPTSNIPCSPRTRARDPHDPAPRFVPGPTPAGPRRPSAASR